MTKHMKIDRLSTSRLKGTSKVPLLIQVQYVKSPEALPKNRANVQMKEAHTTPGPTITVNTRGRRQPRPASSSAPARSEEHTSELQSRGHLVCRLLLEKKKLNMTT